ncbi:hypothetical protein [Acinetobacter bereziniae]|uniref:hypothetical protein n=1 Tax=Acinetobacter bereziniae TaxID=106648 RepID=UPI00124CDC17|nr:hypothetical protein [Acinetobacter bereziniae]
MNNTIAEQIEAEVKAELAKIEYELSDDEIKEFKKIIQLKYEYPDVFNELFNHEEIKKFLNKSYNQLLKKFNKFVHPVYKHSKTIYLEHIGSCFLVAVGKMRFLVSARHVWDDHIFKNTTINNSEIIIEEHLACLHLNRIIPIGGELIRGGLAGKKDIYEHKEEDFIIFNVTDVEFPPEISFLNLTMQDMVIANYTHLLFIGYPNSKNKKLGLAQGKLKKRVTHFLSRKLRENKFLIYQHYPKYAESILHFKKNTTKPNGCSGCPVFSFNVNTNESQLVGMLIEHNKEKIITHIKIEIIFESIKQLYFNEMIKGMIKVYYGED